jgi:hypothetical protein
VIERFGTIVLVAFLATTGCDPSGKPPPKKEIVAKLAYRPLEEATSFRATLESTSELPTMPSKKVQRRTGLYRPIDVARTIRATYFAELDSSRRKDRTWRLDFKSFENKTTTSALKETASSDHELTNATLFVQIGKGEPSVRLESKEHEELKPTQSQIEYGLAIARDLEHLEQWGRFLSRQEFPQGKFVELPDGLRPGTLAETMFGPIESSNGTVSLFRLGLQDGNEVAHFDVHARLNARSERDGKPVFMDIESNGRIVARVVDGLVTSYDLKSKVTPRTPEGQMLPEGSGTWEVHFAIDPKTVGVPQ